MNRPPVVSLLSSLRPAQLDRPCQIRARPGVRLRPPARRRHWNPNGPAAGRGLRRAKTVLALAA